MLAQSEQALLDQITIIGHIPDAQAARLLADVSETRRPSIWTPDLVKSRLSNAARGCEKFVRYEGPSKRITYWIDPSLYGDLSDFDRNARAEGVRAGTRGPDREMKPGASSIEIQQIEHAIHWPARYLASHEKERKVIQVWMWTEAKDQPWERWWRMAAPCKGTANRRRARAFEIICAGLTADREVPSQ